LGALGDGVLLSFDEFRSLSDANLSSKVSSVLAFAVCMGWKTSVSEAVIYVMVIGLSVDYVIHLGRAWQDCLKLSIFVSGEMKHFQLCKLHRCASHQKTWWLLRMQVLVYKEVLPSSVTKWCVLRCICSFKHVFMFLQLESCVHGPC
jgi:hypothetical protein